MTPEKGKSRLLDDVEEEISVEIEDDRYLAFLKDQEAAFNAEPLISELQTESYNNEEEEEEAERINIINQGEVYFE